MGDPTAQYRYDPLLKEWIIYAPKRSVRPFQGQKFLEEDKKRTWSCPFCPDAPEGAGTWVVKQLPNRFASLDETVSPLVDHVLGQLYNSSPNFGKCEVILYSPDHNASFATLTHRNIIALIELWRDRYNAIGQLSQIEYTFIMENRGKEIGNSMSHPHGQIFAFPFLPTKIKRKYESFSEYAQIHKKCLMCDIVQAELADPKRIIEENADFYAEIPYYAHWTYEIHIVAKRHYSSLSDLSIQEINGLAEIMQKVVHRYDILFGEGGIMPYVMAMYNAPYHLSNVNSIIPWHFHIEFYTPFRGKDKWKFLAGVELGTDTFINDGLPEFNAQELRNLKL